MANSKTGAPWYATLGFCGGVIIPYMYMFCLVFWMPRTPRLKVQYLAGLVIYLLTSPFMSIGILLYALYHLNHFSWGKTRIAVTDEGASTPQVSSNTTIIHSRPSDEEASIGLERPGRVYLASPNQAT